MNPECKQGKHDNCDGRAMIPDHDDVVSCSCQCHRHHIVESPPLMLNLTSGLNVDGWNVGVDGHNWTLQRPPVVHRQGSSPVDNPTSG